MKRTIMIVDDDKEILKLLEIYISSEGFEVIKAENGQMAIDLLKIHKIDLMILDVMMPVMDGISACFEIRKEYTFPIIFLSAKSSDIDRITGISSGGDDYIVKPFNPTEIIVRIKSQFRRMDIYNKNLNERNNDEIIILGEIKLDNRSHIVSIRDEVLDLTPTEYEILKLLMSSPGRVFTFRQIYENVWEDEYFESKNTIMVHIRKLREKIEEDTKAPLYIKTVWGVGYKIEE